MNHMGVESFSFGNENKLKILPPNSFKFKPKNHISGYFISGSLDAKVRLWSIRDRQVVDWTDLNDRVTAASYTPDGQV
jgi:WD repeat-containing protein 44